IVFGTLHFGGSPVGELVLETRFSRIPREPPPSTFNYARDIAGRVYLMAKVSRGGVKEPGMGGVMAPAEPGVKRGFERFQGCGFLPFLATAF
ncbi:hypothetical protein, partial [Burkholderia cenocepacia]|uniref:hypothetical protein n=1 Tax=Burkholderia cenocepacia TaxID=95486 RepID=UPI001B99BF95